MDGARGGVHETEATLGDGDVGNEYGVGRNGMPLSELGEEGIGDCIDADCQQTCPLVPLLVGRLLEVIHHLGA